MTKKDIERILVIHETIKEVTDMLYEWPLDKIRRFRQWLQENKNSDNVPW